MAAPGIWKTYNKHASSKVRQISELIEIMSPREVPFLKIVGINGEAGTNPKIEWIEDTLLAETTSVAAGSGLISSNSSTDLDVPTGEGINLQAGMLIKIGAEYMWISSVGTDTAVVVRGVAGTTKRSDIAADEVVEIVGLANNEGSDAPLKGTTEFVLPYNHFQEFDTSYKITLKQKNTKIHGVPNGDKAREMAKAFEEVMIKLERTAFLGVRADVDQVNGVPSLMGGLDYFLSSTYSTRHYSKDAGAKQLTEKMINDMLEDRFYEVGAENMAKTLVVGAWNKRRVNDIFSNYVRTDREDRRGGVKVDVIDTDYGPVDVLLTLRCPKNKVYLVDLDNVSLHPYTGLSFFDQELAKQGAYEWHQIFGSYSMRVRNTKAMGVITNLATSA